MHIANSSRSHTDKLWCLFTCYVLGCKILCPRLTCAMCVFHQSNKVPPPRSAAIKICPDRQFIHAQHCVTGFSRSF